MIYLDNAATTQISPDVLDTMMPYLKEEYGNAGTIYNLGRQAANAISIARKQVSDFIGAEPEQIIFTSGGSEANSLVFHGIRRYLQQKGKKKIIVSSVEHDSVLRAAEALRNMSYCSDEKCIKDEFDIIYLNVDGYGAVPIDELESLLTPDVGLVSVMYVNNETGAINPVKEIGRICSEKNVLFHTDCVQAAGCNLIDVNEIGCDFLSISAHKIHGAKGVGALFAKQKEILSPIVYGGSSQEFGKRGGTENIAGIVGFGKACEIARIGFEEYRNTVTMYKKRFFTKLIDKMKQEGLTHIVKVNGGHKHIEDYGKTLSLRFNNIDSETLMLMLNERGVCVSAGSACRSHESEPSHVLISMGLSPEEARDSIRVSFSEFNTLEEVEYAAKIFVDCIMNLKNLLM